MQQWVTKDKTKPKQQEADDQLTKPSQGNQQQEETNKMSSVTEA